MVLIFICIIQKIKPPELQNIQFNEISKLKANICFVTRHI